MLVFLIYFSLSKTFNKRISEGDQSTPSEGDNVVDKTEGGLLFELLENLNYLLNDGINKTTFLRLFDPDSTESYVLGNYSHYINIASNKAYVPFPSYDGVKYSQYFDVTKTLLSIGDLKKQFTELKSTFKEIQPIIEELGPDLAKALNIDYNTIKRLYDYVLINNDNDDVVFGKIFDILGLSKDWVPNVQKILSVYDSKQPVSKVFEALNVVNEYNDFITKISLLKVPSNDKDNFFSAFKFEDAAISALQLASKAYINCRDMLTNNVMNPLLRTYFIKAINIFEYSIGNRAISLANLIDKIQGYSRYCSYETTGLEEYKCLVYSYTNAFLAQAFCEHDSGDYDDYEDEEEPQCDALPKLKGLVIEFTYPQVNLTKILADRLGISTDYINIAATLTDSTKNYVDVLTAVLKVIHVDQEELSFIYELPDFINFLNKIDQSTNFKRIYDFLHLPMDSWINATTFIKEISEKKPLCQNSFLKKFETEEGTCLIEEYITHYSSSFISEEHKLYESFQDYEEMIRHYVPLARDLAKPLSNLLNAVFKLMAEQELSSTPFIKRTGELLNVLIKSVDDVLPYIIKEVPVVKEFYPKGKEAFTNIFNQIKEDKDIKSLLNTLYDGIGVIIDLVSSAGNAILNNEDITLAAFTKSIKPTSFLNFFETVSALSKIKGMTLHNIAESITYDGSKSSSKLLATRIVSINDLAPAKTLILNSEELAQSFEKKDLRIGTISKSLGVSENDLKQLISSLIEPAVSVPYNGIKNVLVHYSTKTESQITSDLNQLCSLLKSVAAGQNINTDVDGSYQPPTPSRSPVPIVDDTIKEDNFLGEIDISGIEPDKVKKEIQDFIDEVSKKADPQKNNFIKITGGEVPSGLILTDNIYIIVDKDVAVNIGTEEMSLSLTKDSPSAKIKPSGAEVGLSINNNYTSTLEIQPPEGETSIIITKSSEIRAPITFVVPPNVDLVIDTLNLHSNARISAQSKNEKGETADIPVTVKKIVALQQTEARLSQVKIKESLTIKGTASLRFTDVEFDKDSKLNLDMTTFAHSSYDYKPFIFGDIGKPPKTVVLNPPDKEDESPSENDEYVLFTGNFASSCKEWEVALNIDNIPEFDQKKCTEPTASSAGLLEANTLVVFKKPKDPKKNKLGPGPIAGIVVGCVAAVVIVVVVVVVVIKKKKNSKNESTDEDNDNDEK